MSNASNKLLADATGVANYISFNGTNFNGANFNGTSAGGQLAFGTSNSTYNGLCLTPGATGSRATLFGCGVDPTRGFNFQAAGTGNLYLGNQTNGAAVQVTDCGGSCGNVITLIGSVTGAPPAVTCTGDANCTLLLEGHGTKGVAIVGVSDGSAAGAGAVGEIIKAQVLIASAVPLASGTTMTIATINLTSGDWNIEGDVDFVLNGATTTNFQAGTSPTNNAIGGQDSYITRPSLLSAATTTTTEVVPLRTLQNFTATTTSIYLVANATFSAGTVHAAGQIIARRVR